jgi:hypothetical protein
MIYFGKFTLFILSLLLSLFLTGCSKIYTHSPDLAACTGLNFLNALIIKQDVSKAYILADDALKAVAPQSKVKPFIVSMHPRYFPVTLKPAIYEVIPGQNLINIYYLGQNKDESFIYRVQLIGDKITKYKVFAFFRQSNLPKTSSMVFDMVTPTCTN